MSRAHLWALALCFTVASCSAFDDDDGGSGVVVPPASDSIPTVDPVASPTSDPEIEVTGRAISAGSLIVVDGGADPAEATSGADRRFSVLVDLVGNAVNHLFVREVPAVGVASPVVPLEVVQDSQAPDLFVDSPEDGAFLTETTLDVSGRISDVLSGFQGLSVRVNGIVASVNIGQGTNGTFIARDVPIDADATTQIIAEGRDAVGNVITRTITVFHETPNGPRLVLVSGDDQSAQVQQTLLAPLRVRVVDESGAGLASKPVTFDVLENDGRVGSSAAETTSISRTVVSDAQGYAQVYWRLGGAAGMGNNRVHASSTRVAGTIVFLANASAGAAAQINVSGGAIQIAQADGVAPLPLEAWVSDACNGVSGVPVRFRVVEGGGYVTSDAHPTPAVDLSVPTDATGHAQVRLVLAPQGGKHVVEANFVGNTGNPVRFQAVGEVRSIGADTTFSGLVLDNANRPIGGATVHLSTGATSFPDVLTGSDGRFELTDLGEGGASHLRVNGLTATTLDGEPIPLGSFPSLFYDVVVLPETENRLPMPVLLPPLDPANVMPYSTTSDTMLTVAEIAGLEMIVRAGSMSIDGAPAPDGTLMSLDQVHHDDVPMPMPDGAAPPFAWTLQPGGAHFDPPVEIRYPNMTGLPAGAFSYFLSFNHETSRFEIVAPGRVSDDGSTIETPLGSGISIAGWGCNCPPYSSTADCENCRVRINGPPIKCVVPDQPATFTAQGNPSGGTYAWSGGTPTGGTSGASYSATFPEGFDGPVSVTYTCPESGSVTRSARVKTSPEPVTVSGLKGDILTIDVSSTGLEQLAFRTTTNAIGMVAQIDSYTMVLRDDGKFYFRPTTVGMGTIQLEGRCLGAPASAAPVTVDVNITVADGYSTSGPEVVMNGTTKLTRYRQQQRLWYFAFPDNTGAVVGVDGVAGAGTRHAIGLFNSACADSDFASASDFTASGLSFINATNAPRWKEVASGTGVTFSYVCSSGAERWATSWAEEVLHSAGATAAGDSLSLTVTACSKRMGANTSCHASHEAGMDIDIDTPPVGNAPFYGVYTPTGGTTQYVRAHTTDDPDGLNHVIVVGAGPTYSAGLISAGLGSALVHTAALLDNQTTLSAIQALIVDAPGYDLDEVQSKIDAFLTAAGASGAATASIFHNDPRTWSTNVTFSTGHSNHFHVNIAAPAPAAPLTFDTGSIASAELSPAGSFGPTVSDTSLDESWAVTINGQTVPVGADGAFLVSNISAPDLFGASGPGSAPDFLSDNFLRMIGTSRKDGVVRYAYSQPFRIRDGERAVIGDLVITETPPIAPVSITLDLGVDVLTAIDATAQAEVIATLSDGSRIDVSSSSQWTTYGTSNPAVVRVDAEGVVTGAGNGVAFVRATNEGPTAVKQIVVSAGDPLTTVVGLVRFEGGGLVEGAEVRVVGFTPVATTGADGAFVLPNIPTLITPLLTVTARKHVGDQLYYGSVGGLTPEPGDITDAGIVEISPVDCAFETDQGVLFLAADDTFAPFVFTGGFTFPYYGQVWTDCNVGTNGYITFGFGDDDYTPTEAEAVRGGPRIAAAYYDLYPNIPNGVYVRQLADRFVVTWLNVPEFGEGGSNTIQIQLFADGRVQYLYNGMTSTGATRPIWVGLSSGLSTADAVYLDYSTVGATSTNGPNEAPFEVFDGTSPFDLDFACLSFTPNASGGFDVAYGPSGAALYGDGNVQLRFTPRLLDVLESQGEGLDGTELVLRSSRGLTLRKPLIELHSRRSGFALLPVPAAYGFELVRNGQRIATASALLRNRGERVEVELTEESPPPVK